MASAYVKEKSIVITGGTVGLGLAFIRECLENGAKVSNTLQLYSFN